MRCGECGTENATGAEFCSECGKTMTVALGLRTAFDDLQSICPGPAPDEPAADLDGVCSLCSERCSTREMRRVREAMYCAECVPLVRAGSVAAGGDAPSGRGAPAPEDLSVRAGASTPSFESSGEGGGIRLGSSPIAPPSFGIHDGGGARSSAPAPSAPVGLAASPSPFPAPGGGGFDSGPVEHVRSSARPVRPVRSERRFPLVAVVGLLVLGVGGFLLWHFVLGKDRIDGLVAEAQAAERSVRLTPRYEVGKTVRYRLSGSMQFDVSGQGGGQSFDGGIGITGSLGCYLDVLDVDDAGSADMQLALDDVDVEFDTSGDMDMFRSQIPALDLESLRGETMRFRVDRRGRMMGNPDATSKIGFLHGMSTGMAEGGWPDRELRPGDEWTETMDGGAAAGPMTGMDLPVRFTMIGFARHLGRDCAVIEMEADVEQTEDGGVMRVDLHGVAFVDETDGMLVHLALDMDMEANASMMGASLSMEGSATVDFQLE